jgi:uncharacterized UBP type Zn finger protein
MRTKDRTKVYNEPRIDFGQFLHHEVVDGDGTSAWYRLTAVLDHVGTSLHSGHYIFHFLVCKFYPGIY